MRKYIATVVVSLVLFGCGDKEKFYPSIISTEPEYKSELDKWIDSEYGIYNIDVLYKWDDFKTNQEYELVPVQEKMVQPCLEVIQQVWMNPYLAQDNEKRTFFKATCPKQLVLLGSAVYQESGSNVIGETAQGNSITLYNLNHQDPTDNKVVEDYAQVFHHEFAHILHQNVDYPVNYEALSGSNYTSDWQAVVTEDAQDLGFITPYAMESPNEDFAEMVSNFIVTAPAAWEAYMINTSYRSPVGYNILRQKEAIVIQYMQAVWGIDLYRLRDDVQAAINKYKEGNLPVEP